MTTPDDVPNALIVDPDPLSRNAMRVALEHVGFEVSAFADLPSAERVRAPAGYRVVVLDEGLDDEGADKLMERMRSRLWRGTFLVTTDLVRDTRRRHLMETYGVAAVFGKPLVLGELKVRVPQAIPGAKPGTRRPDAGIPHNWSGALRKARKEYGDRLPSWVNNLAHELNEARRADTDKHVAEAMRLAKQIATDATQYSYAAIAETAQAVADDLQRVRDGDASLTQTQTWGHLSDLMEVMIAGLPPHQAAFATLDTGQVEQHALTVLVVSADLKMLMALAAAADSADIGVLTARSLEEAIKVANRRRVDAAILTTELPSGGVQMLSNWLRRQPGQAELPFAYAVPQGEVEDPQQQARARAQGARFLIAEPMDGRHFLDAVRRLTQGARATSRTALVISADDSFASFVQRTLVQHRIRVVHDRGAEDIENRLAQVGPDVLIVGVTLPGESGFDVVRTVRASDQWSTLPVVFATDQTSPQVRAACFRAGGDDCIVKPVVEEELTARVTSLLSRFRSVRQLDGLTHLLTRATFLEQARRRLEADDAPYAAAVLDLDYFHEVNAHFGYSVGDRVLARVGHAIEDGAGTETLVGRWGDDQFALLYARESRSSAADHLTRLAHAIRRITFDAGGGRNFQISAQMGVSATNRVAREIGALMREAERTLRQAKDARG